MSEEVMGEGMGDVVEASGAGVPSLTVYLHGLIVRPARMEWRTDLGLVGFLRRQLSVRIKKGFCVQGAGCNCCARRWR